MSSILLLVQYLAINATDFINCLAIPLTLLSMVLTGTSIFCTVKNNKFSKESIKNYKKAQSVYGKTIEMHKFAVNQVIVDNVVDVLVKSNSIYENLSTLDKIKKNSRDIIRLKTEIFEINIKMKRVCDEKTYELIETIKLEEFTQYIDQIIYGESLDVTEYNNYIKIINTVIRQLKSSQEASAEIISNKH